MILAIQRQTGASIRTICRTLEAPRSGFYHAAKPTPRQRHDDQLAPLIESIFSQHRQRYGHRRIWHQLADQGVVCAPTRIRRIMRQRGLRALQPRNFIPKTSDGKALKPAPNLLAQRPFPSSTNQVWTSDITFIPTQSGWLYLAVVMDLYSRRILGWSLADHLRSELVLQAFSQALASRPRRGGGIVFHSDRGSQYGSGLLRRALRHAGFRQSMSATSNPYDNAWTESWIGTLKREMLRCGRFLNLQDAQTEIFEYIEAYYNPHRKHSALNHLSPLQFELRSLNPRN